MISLVPFWLRWTWMRWYMSLDITLAYWTKCWWTSSTWYPLILPFWFSAMYLLTSEQYLIITAVFVYSSKFCFKEHNCICSSLF
jgi:hypothetical protein